MYGYIYKTTNLVNGKIYVGQHKATAFMKRRYLGSGVALKEAINKYGRQNFIVDLLDTAETFEELNQKEIYGILKLNATDPTVGYNISPGGQPEDIHIIVKDSERKYVSFVELMDYLALGGIDTRSEAWQKARIKEYYKKHPVNYTEEQKARKKQTDHEHYIANREKYIKNAQLWQQQHKDAANNFYHKNKDRLNEAQRDRYKTDPEFKARQLEKARKYREANKELINKRQQERRKKSK